MDYGKFIEIWKEIFLVGMNTAQYRQKAMKSQQNLFLILNPKALTIDVYEKKEAKKRENCNTQQSMEIFANDFGINEKIEENSRKLFEENGKESPASKILSGYKYNEMDYKYILRVISAVIYQFLQTFTKGINDADKIDLLSVVIKTFSSIKIVYIRNNIYHQMKPVIEEMIAKMSLDFVNQSETINNLYKNMFNHAVSMSKLEYLKDYNLLLGKFISKYIFLTTDRLKNSKNHDEVLSYLNDMKIIFETFQEHPNFLQDKLFISHSFKVIDMIKNYDSCYNEVIYNIFMLIFKVWANVFKTSQILKKEYKMDIFVSAVIWIIENEYSFSIDVSPEQLTPLTIFDDSNEDEDLIFRENTFDEMLEIKEYSANIPVIEEFEVDLFIEVFISLIKHMNILQLNELLSIFIDAIQPTKYSVYVQTYICYLIKTVLSTISDEYFASINTPWKNLLSSILYSQKLNNFVHNKDKGSFFKLMVNLKHEIMTFFVKVALLDKKEPQKESDDLIDAITEFSDKSIYNFISSIPLLHLVMDTAKEITVFSKTCKLWKIITNYARVIRNKHLSSKTNNKEKKLTSVVRIGVLQFIKRVYQTNVELLDAEDLSKPYFDIVYEKKAFNECIILFDKSINKKCPNFFIFLAKLVNDLSSFDNIESSLIINNIISLVNTKGDEEKTLMFEALIAQEEGIYIKNLAEKVILRSNLKGDSLEGLIICFIDMIYNFGAIKREYVERMSNLNIYKAIEEKLIAVNKETISWVVLLYLVRLATDNFIHEDNEYIIKNHHVLHLIFEVARRNEKFQDILEFFKECCQKSYSNCIKISQQGIPEILIDVISQGRENVNDFSEIQNIAIDVFKCISKCVMSHSTISKLILSMSQFTKSKGQKHSVYRVVTKKNPLLILMDIMNDIIREKRLVDIPGLVSLYRKETGFIIEELPSLPKTWTFVAKFVIDSVKEENKQIQRDIINFKSEDGFIRLFIDEGVVWAESNLMDTKVKVTDKKLTTNAFITLVCTFINRNKLKISLSGCETKEIDFKYPMMIKKPSGRIFYSSSDKDDNIVTNVSCFHIIPGEVDEEKIIGQPPIETSEIPSSIVSISTMFIHENICENHSESVNVTLIGEYFKYPQTLVNSICYVGGINVFQEMLMFSFSGTLNGSKTDEKTEYINHVFDLITNMMTFDVLQDQYFSENGITILSHIFRKLKTKNVVFIDKLNNMYNKIPEEHPERKVAMLQHIFYEQKLWAIEDDYEKKLIQIGHQNRVSINPVPHVIDIYKIIPGLKYDDKEVFDEIVSNAEVNFTQKDHNALIFNLIEKKKDANKNFIDYLSLTIDLLREIHKNEKYNEYFSNDEDFCSKFALILQNTNFTKDILLKVMKFVYEIVHTYKSRCFAIKDFVRNMLPFKFSLSEVQEVIDKIATIFPQENDKTDLIPLFIFMASFSKCSNCIDSIYSKYKEFFIKNPEMPIYMSQLALCHNGFFLKRISSIAMTIINENPLAIDIFYFLLTISYSKENFLISNSLEERGLNNDILATLICYTLFTHENAKTYTEVSLSVKKLYKILRDIKAPDACLSSFILRDDFDYDILIDLIEKLNKPRDNIKKLIGFASGVLVVIMTKRGDDSDDFKHNIFEKYCNNSKFIDFFIHGLHFASNKCEPSIRDNLISPYDELMKKSSFAKKCNINDLIGSIIPEKRLNIIKEISQYKRVDNKALHDQAEEFSNEINEEIAMQYVEENCAYKSYTKTLYQIDGPWDDSDDYNFSLLPKLDAHGRIIMLCVKLDFKSNKGNFPDEIKAKTTAKVEEYFETLTNQKYTFYSNCYYSTEDCLFTASERIEDDKVVIFFIEETFIIKGKPPKRGYEERIILLNDIIALLMGRVEKQSDVLKYNSIKDVPSVEIFLNNGKSYQLAFFTDKDAVQFAEEIESKVPSNVKKFIQTNTDSVSFFKNFSHIKDWKEGRISNAEFLMRLSLFSGFSFRNFNRYPVFPFLYTDIDPDKAKKRDLKYLNIAQTPEDRENCQMRYELEKTHTIKYITDVISMGIKIPQLPPWEDAHYRNNGSVDTTRLHSKLNLSIVEHDATECPSLWFMLPQMFENYNNYYRSDQGTNTIYLPGYFRTWFSFVQYNSNLLESDEVSKEINNWIDIVFGIGNEEKNKEVYFTAFPKIAEVSSPCQQILKSEVGQRIKGRTVINTDLISASKEVTVDRIFAMQINNNRPAVVTKKDVIKLSSEIRGNDIKLKLKSEKLQKQCQKDYILAFSDENTFFWSPATCAITKMFNKKEEKISKDYFAITKKIYNLNGAAVIIREDCSVEKVGQDNKRIYFKTHRIGEYLASDLSTELRILVICSSSNVIIVDPYNGQTLSLIDITNIIKEPTMIKLVDTPAIVISNKKEIVVERVDQFMRGNNEERMRKCLLSKYKTSDTITSICAVDLVGSQSNICVFTSNKKCYVFNPTQHENEDCQVSMNIEEEKEIQLEIEVRDSVYNKDDSVVYGTDLVNRVIAVNINAEPVELNLTKSGSKTFKLW